MNEVMAKEIIEKIKVEDITPTYASLKDKEEELLAQLKDIQEEIKIAEKNVIKEKLNTALQCLADVDEMTSGLYRCSVEAYCEGCEEDIDIDIDLVEIIEALQRIR